MYHYYVSKYIIEKLKNRLQKCPPEFDDIYELSYIP